MEYVQLLDNLKLALALRYNDQKSYRRKIMDVLGLSLSVVSRRLSGQSAFTVQEVAIICEALDIPVDEVFNTCSHSTRLPMEFIQSDFPLDDRGSLERFNWPVELFSLAARSEDSTFYVTCNTFPDILNPTFDWVARFWKFRWLFFNRESRPVGSLSGIVHLPGEQELMERYISAVHSLKKSVYIVSDRIVENYIDSIKRFYISGHISKEEVICLVREMGDVLELFEKVCMHGYLEGGKEMEIYYTNLFFQSDMYVVQSDKIRFGVFYLSPLNPVVTRSETVCDTMVKWFDLWRHSATLISQSGTHLRQVFMDVQRTALEAFKAELGM